MTDQVSPSDGNLHSMEEVQQYIEAQLSTKVTSYSAQKLTKSQKASAQEVNATLALQFADALRNLLPNVPAFLVDFILKKIMEIPAIDDLKAKIDELLGIIREARNPIEIVDKVVEWWNRNFRQQPDTPTPDPIETPSPSKHEFVDPVPADPNNPERVKLLSLNGAITDETLLKLIRDEAANKTNPLELRKIVIKQAFPGGKTQSNLAIVRSVVAGAGGGSHLRLFKSLPEAVLYEVYSGRTLDQIDKLEEADVREFGRRIFNTQGPLLYKHKIRKLIDELGGQLDDDSINSVYDYLTMQRVPLDAPDFATQVARAVEATQHERKYYKFFRRDGVDVFDEFRQDIQEDAKDKSVRQRRAVRFLDQIGLDPTKADVQIDDDWARIALGLTGSSGRGQDALNLIGIGDHSRAFDNLDTDLNFPDWDTDYSVGLNSKNIRTSADLYYIHQFERIGIFRVVDAIAVRFFEDMNLDVSETAAKLYRYVKLRSVRFPEADRQRITHELFESDENGKSEFKALVGRMVEALIEYNQSRNAGEFFLANGQNGAVATPYKRSGVIRAIQNLQRYLSDIGGGIRHFLRLEAGSQLMECFDILNSDDLKAYFGGGFNSGMFAIIEQVIRELDGETPPVDRGITLAVHGRKMIQWLADNTANIRILTDSDLDQLTEHVDQWLAAYRRLDSEPDWVEDDDSYYDEEDVDQIIEDEIRDAVGEDEMDVLGEI